MKKLQEYTRKELEPKTISELEWPYMGAFKNSKILNTPESNSRLEIITDILFSRDDVKEKRIVCCQIKLQLAEAVKSEKYEEAAIFRDMLNHYEQHIMG